MKILTQLFRRSRGGYSFGSTLAVLAGSILTLGAFLGVATANFGCGGGASHHKILFRHWDWVNGVSYSPDGRYLASGSDDGTAVLWDAANGAVISQLEGHRDLVDPVRFSPNGRYLATASHDGTARLWAVPSGRLMAILSGHRGPLYDLAFTASGKYLATAGDCGEVMLWSVPAGARVASVKIRGGERLAPAIWSLAAHPRSNLLAAGAEDGAVRVYQWHETDSGGVELRQLGAAKGSEGGSINDVVFSADGGYLASAGDDGAVLVWETDSGLRRHLLRLHEGPILTIAFSPDGKLLASGGEDGTARLWEVATGEPRATLVGHRKWVESLAFSPNGRKIATGSEDNTVRIWRVSNGRQCAKLVTAAPSDTDGWVEQGTVAFSPDGRFLATAGSPLVARIWDLVP